MIWYLFASLFRLGNQEDTTLFRLDDLCVMVYEIWIGQGIR